MVKLPAMEQFPLRRQEFAAPWRIAVVARAMFGYGLGVYYTLRILYNEEPPPNKNKTKQKNKYK